ncbi:hypothetical protein CNMCM5793_008657 [Aspergillus hiratsukae]|uniref:Uncharacterized protein n=1 Tax=Aspergillus hiratsukae TaxID=1194566 RepID=A0A8H6Q718_9EURO|nr:hypothetical protein CNMCM5793_008657 [Aspergillus hiratsukae]KAF7166716.1 hypothetical protein CNMCM6106_002403 [Aspergillus hiratsukae]
MKLVGCVVPKKEAFQPPRGVPAALGELRLGGSAAVSEDMTADVHVVGAPSAESGGEPTNDNNMGKLQKTPRQGSTEATDPRNFTSFREDQKDWSWDNLPAILYQFKPTKDEEKKEREPPKTKILGGKRVRDIEILPHHISSDVEEFRVETWMRLDRRIHLQDIIDRMHKDFAIERNALQQRNVRFRKAFHLIAWSSGNKITCQLEQDVLKRMSEAGIDPTLNSTRGLTPGLIDPQLGEAGGCIALPDNYGPDKRGHRGPRTPREKRNAAKVEEDVDMDDLDPTTPVRKCLPLTPPSSRPASSVKPGPSFAQSAASEESMTTIFSPPSPVTSSTVSYSPILSSPVLSSVSSSGPGSPVLSFTVPEEDHLDSPLEETLYDGDLCPCNSDFLLKGESRQNLDWQHPCEEELSGLQKGVPKVLKARHRPQMKRQHKACKKALPFCNADAMYAKFASKFDLDDMINVVPVSRATAPPAPDRLPPSFIYEPLKMRLTFNQHTTDESTMNWTYAVALNQYYAGQQFLFEMPYVEGVM